MVAAASTPLANCFRNSPQGASLYVALGALAFLCVGTACGGAAIVLGMLRAAEQRLTAAFALGWFCVPALVAAYGSAGVSPVIASHAQVLFLIAAAFLLNCGVWLVADRVGGPAAYLVALCAPLLPAATQFLPYPIALAIAGTIPLAGKWSVVTGVALLALLRTSPPKLQVIACAGLATLAIALFPSNQQKFVEGGYLSTELQGSLRVRSEPAEQYRVLAEIEAVAQPGATVLTPEAALGVAGPGILLAASRTHSLLASFDARALVGALVPASAVGMLVSGVLVLGDGGQPKFVATSYLVPGLRDNTLAGAENAASYVNTVDRRHAAENLFVCYEELLGGMLWTLHERKALAILANHWWDQSGLLAGVQRHYSRVWLGVVKRNVRRADTVGESATQRSLPTTE